MKKIPSISDLTRKAAHDLISDSLENAAVAQLDRASDYGSEGWEFDPLQLHFNSSFAGNRSPA